MRRRPEISWPTFEKRTVLISTRAQRDCADVDRPDGAGRRAGCALACPQQTGPAPSQRSPPQCSKTQTKTGMEIFCEQSQQKKLLDHLVGGDKQPRRHGQAERTLGDWSSN